MKALQFSRKPARYAAAMIAGAFKPGAGATVGPLRLRDLDEPEAPADGWVTLRPRLSGICGSDLSTIDGHSSRYFEPIVSFPFVPGHEVVGELLEDLDDLKAGRRVVLSPVLGCPTRGIEPWCENCKNGDFGRCDRVTAGHVSPGLQTGYCKDTGGGWSKMFVAHRSQLHAVPGDLDDERAVLIEPLACAIHSAMRARVDQNDHVLVVGAGTVGALVTTALRTLTPAGRITVVAKHEKQRELARRMGADDVIPPGEATNAVRRSAHTMKLSPERGSPFLLGGVDVAIEAAGSRGGLDTALRTTKAGGRVVLSAIPAVGVDLTPVWFRELEVVGAYTGGTETVDGEQRGTFELAIELAATAPLEGVVGARYPLSRWREAIDHALAAGKLGTSKVVFEP